MSIAQSLLDSGEFELGDKIQSPDHLKARLNFVRGQYKESPEATRIFFSYAWPHPAGRAWTHTELSQKLGVPSPVPEENKLAMSMFLKAASAQIMQEYLPSMAAAWDAFSASRQQQQALDQMRYQERFPAMSYSQPMMAQYSQGMGGGSMPSSGLDLGGGFAPPVTHHRHRHHSG